MHYKENFAVTKNNTRQAKLGLQVYNNFKSVWTWVKNVNMR